jgi:hypothetical protein
LIDPELLYRFYKQRSEIALPLLTAKSNSKSRDAFENAAIGDALRSAQGE